MLRFKTIFFETVSNLYFKRNLCCIENDSEKNQTPKWGRSPCHLRRFESATDAYNISMQ